MSDISGRVKKRIKSLKPVKIQAEADALFLSMGYAVITTDDYGTITRANPSALKILGYEKNEIVGKPFLTTIKAETADGKNVNKIDRPITQAFLEERAVSGNMYYITKNGARFPVEINVSPVIINNQLTGAVEIFRDVTVEQEVDRMKSEFISLASHQLRTPLSAIKTYSHMLNDGYMGELNESQKKSLETIIKASNRMNELITTLLNITRIESGQIALKPKKLRLEKIIAEVLPEHHLMADSKGITMKLKVTNGASTEIKTDALVIKEVASALLSNAIKYTPENGQVDIIISPRAKEIVVEIRDTGWGIPLKSHDQVFSKFFRGSNIIKHETSGTGLGLYLVKGLIDTLGGRIWFKSITDKGTSFYFAIPRTVPKNAL